MAGYIAWYGKKLEKLAAHEREFVALLQTETDVSRLADGAEAVRAAQIRGLNAKRAMLPPSEKNAVAVANLDREIEFWTSRTVDQIIEGYRTGKLRGHRAAASRKAST